MRRSMSVEVLKERIFRFGEESKDHEGPRGRAWVPDNGEDENYFVQIAIEIGTCCYELYFQKLGIREIAERLCQTFKVNAVEVVDFEGRGAVCYADWP